MEMKRIHLVNIVIFTVCFTFLALLPGCATGPEKVYRIGEVMIVEHPDLLADQEGFHQALAENGLIKGENVEYIFLCAEGDMSIAHTIAQKFVSEKVDLIHAISTPVAMACASAAEGTGIPLVFSTVSNPVVAGLVDSWENPGPHNRTGVSDKLDAKSVVKMITDICPDCRKLGIVYDAGEANAVATVNDVKAILPDFDIEPVEANVPSSAEIMTAAKSLVGRCDVMWWPDSNTVAAGFESLITVCEQNQIPLFGPTGWSVEGGCIGACGVHDYGWIGREAGYMAARILLEGLDPADIRVTTPAAEQTPTLNPAAAERMGITIPNEVLDEAYEVVTEE